MNINHAYCVIFSVYDHDLINLQNYYNYKLHYNTVVVAYL